MIDATKAPTPAWKRYGIMALLAVLIVVAAFMVWKKELHHSGSGSASPPAAAVVNPLTPTAPAKAASRPTTTVPGGLPISSRDPFGG